MRPLNRSESVTRLPPLTSSIQWLATTLAPGLRVSHVNPFPLSSAVTTNTAGDGTTAANGGAIAVVSDTLAALDRSSVSITKNTLDGNVAKNAAGNVAIAFGGGIFVSTGSVSGLGTETVAIGTTGKGNIVRNGTSEGLGGGISVKRASESCRF